MASALTPAGASGALGWAFSMALDAGIVITGIWVMYVAAVRANRFLRQRGHGDAVAATGTALTLVLCFMGLWLPVGLILVSGWLRSRWSMRGQQHA
jgi:hypothetical protein